MSVRDEHLQCLRCNRTLVAVDVWSAATKPERAAMKARGMARASRRDMCSTCHQYLRSHNQLDRYTPEGRRTPDEISPKCVRCGHGTLNTGELCRDCADVTYDLHEREVWTA